MACATTVLRRKSRDVGGFLRRVRSMVDGKGISAAFGDNRARGRGASRPRLSIAQQRRLSLRCAVVHSHQRKSGPAESFWRFKILANEISRRLQKAYRVQHARFVRRQSIRKLSAHPETTG